MTQTVADDLATALGAGQGDYTAIAELGKGAYGVVYKAVDGRTQEVVAIKKCRHVFERTLSAKRCLREIKLLSHFDHPNIVNLRALFVENETTFDEVYIVQDCYAGTLYNIIHGNVEMTPAHHQWFMYQIFCALKYIHSANVLHRDLKPSNILVNRSGHICLCDFGMARGMYFQGNSQALTTYVVTRWYRAPEVMISNANYGKAIDLWSAGCVFAELLGRRVLFRGRDAIDQLHKIIETLGLPADTSFWEGNVSSFVIGYVNELRSSDGTRPPEEPVDFQALYPDCDSAGIDLLQQLLDLNPVERITAEEALEHPYVEIMREDVERDEPVCQSLFDFENFESLTDNQQIRERIVREVLQFQARPHRQDSSTTTEYDSTTPSPVPTRRHSVDIPTPLMLPSPQRSATVQIPPLSTLIRSAPYISPSAGGMFMEFVNEPEDMVISPDPLLGRQLVAPTNTDVQALERHLSVDR